jgi:hypothetical protein
LESNPIAVSVVVDEYGPGCTFVGLVDRTDPTHPAATVPTGCTDRVVDGCHLLDEDPPGSSGGGGAHADGRRRRRRRRWRRTHHDTD